MESPSQANVLQTDEVHVLQTDEVPELQTDEVPRDDWIPKVGMEFNDIEEAWKFWKAYGFKTGFGVRRRGNNGAKDGAITSSRFVCDKQGHRAKREVPASKSRAETRMDCKARMHIQLIRNTGKYRVYEFVDEHSHPLHFVECTHLIRSHRHISAVQAQQIVLADDAGLTPRQQHDLSSVQAGGRENAGYTRVDVRNYLRTKRGRDMEFGDAGCLLTYFERRQIMDTSFFYAVQLDSNEQITNIFWADYRMIIDYAIFGDVVTFDTTFSTNKEFRPLGVFIGLNHHRELVIFGAALLYDETADSFKWLFETFLRAHKEKRPITVFTDQDSTMAKALGEVIPEARHGLCTWHLMQNAMKNVGHLMKSASSFLPELNKLVYEYVEEQKFEEGWRSLLSTPQARENSWLHNLYKLKEKWARCYMKSTVTLGIRSTQLSESLNGDMKDYLKCTVNLNGFFKKFDKVVLDKRYKEVQAEFNARQKLPTILVPTSPTLQQAAKVYTPSMFRKFQDEWMKQFSLIIKERNEIGGIREYIVCSFGANELEHKVTFGPGNDEVNCACNHFGTVGFLCCHALKVLDAFDIKLIPPAYILKRWTRQARNGILERHGLDTQRNGDMDATDRYRELCPEYVKVTAKGTQTAEGYEYLKKMLLEINRTLDAMDWDPVGETQETLASTSIEKNRTCAGLAKKKDGTKGGKRHKSCLERNRPKKKKKDAPEASSQASARIPSEQPTDIVGSLGFYSSLLTNWDVPQEDLLLP